MAVAFRQTANGSGTGSPIACNVPAGTTDGDLMLAFGTYTDNTGITDTMSPPAGWSTAIAEWNDGAASPARTTVWYRIASSEPASYNFTHGGGSSTAKVVINSYSGVNTSTPVNASATGSGSGTSITFPSVTTTVANTLLVCYVGFRGGSNTGTPPAGFSERVDLNAVSGPQHEDSDNTQAATGATGTFTGSIASSNAWVSCTIAIAPTPATTSTSDFFQILL